MHFYDVRESLKKKKKTIGIYAISKGKGSTTGCATAVSYYYYCPILIRNRVSTNITYLHNFIIIYI